MANYIEINSKTACNKVDSNFLPFNWDLNIYRGCEHKCQYCFALYSHKYINSTNFFDNIYVKKNIVGCFEKQISSKKWKRTIVNIGGVTDSYQPAEKQYKLMPEILKLCIKYKVPVTLSTKSKLILRDFDLFAELSKFVPVNIACTITTVNEKVRKLIEPNAATSLERFNNLKEFSKTNVNTGIFIMPIIPELTDSYNNLSLLYKIAKQNNVNYAITAILNLRGETKIQFLNFIKNKLPHLYGKINSYYKSAYVNSAYKKRLNTMLNRITEKYPLKEKEINYPDYKNIDEQFYLF
ncbi:SPL family radical SAM protein [Candidatus Ruminimicrobium bovinum]|uniref:SPL family radical SAM protein n=1 Tax=Candidatus Ruminimicrobium bovinum TaxID=3242779 RepID=UPI0039B82A60